MSRSGHGPGARWSVMLDGTGQMSGSTQGQRVRRAVGASPRERERGVALVEFAFVAVIFFGLVFAIIGYGVALSFKQTVTQSVNEAARAAAVTEDDDTTVADERVQAARDVIDQFEAWGKSCNSPSTCTITVHDCSSAGQTNALPDCITVALSYPYRADPIVPAFPLLGVVLPETVSGSATAQLTFGG
jgi:Flp pilus assembly protein TadG